jgi:hypothetical protein
MAQSATRHRPVAKSPATHRRGVHPPRGGTMVDRTTELSDEVLKSIEAGQLAAIEAVHKFLESGDRALPPFGEGPSRRQQVLDAAMEMADRLVQTQYDFIRKLIDSTATSLSEDDGAKANGVK